MRIHVHRRCSDYRSYRAARVKSLFNVESGCNFQLDADLPIDDQAWKIGVIVGPSGSGKTSAAAAIWPKVGMYKPRWPAGRPIIDAIAPGQPFDDVAAALSAVGLGNVPSWLRPFRVLSNGEQFRANLARLISERPRRAKVDEFSSVVDRQIARIGALAFGKAWRRCEGQDGCRPQVIVCSCHYDIIDWLQPCWVFDTATGKYAGRGLWRRPAFELEVHQTDWRYWKLFEPHHYLKMPLMIGATCYVGTVNGELVAHIGVSTRPGLTEARACRLVVMPEWQGAGVGLRFLNHVCQLWLEGKNRYRLKMPTLFHTSHPGLCAALRRDPHWAQVSAMLHGDNKLRSAQSMSKSGSAVPRGHGGHFRAVQGFRYYGVER